MTLLEEAKKVPMGKSWTKCMPEDVELVLAFLRNEITATQIEKVKNFAHGSLYCYFLAVIQFGIANKIIEIKEMKK